MHVYYKTGYGGVAPRAVRSFPQGLRMIAGDAKAQGPQNHVRWTCGSTNSKSIPTNCAPGDTLVMSLDFPQCWDGRNLDSADHKSHMAYPNNGCPSSHPVPIPVITFQVEFPVPSAGSAHWRLSSDMYDPSLPGGYSVHGDWFAAWDQAIVDEFVRNCDNAAVDCFSHLLGPNREIY
jgi:hypothetical protein